MPTTPFEDIWNRIISHQGEIFHTKSRLEFTYRIEGNRFYSSRAEWIITKTDFIKAYKFVPIAGPGLISSDVMGPSYVWAVLHDKRISLGMW